MTPRTVHVIGRGIVGLATAFALQRRGVQVVILGPRQRPGSASRAAVGTSTLKGNIQASSAFFALKLRGHAGLPAWLAAVEQAAGGTIPRDFTGAFEPFYSAKEYAWQRQRIFHRQFTGCLRLKVAPQLQLAGRFASTGAFPAKARGAFHYFNDGWFDPVACLDALEEALRRGGAAFRDEVVAKVLPSPAGGQLIHLGAESDGAVLQAEATVLAAGIFSDEILAASELSAPRQELVEGETLVAPAGALHNLVLKLGKMNLVVHGGQVRVGSTARRQASVAACALDPGGEGELAAIAAAQLGPFPAFTPLWGIRGRFKDHAPAIGSLKWSQSQQRLWVATGFYKNGLQLAPSFAEKLAALLLQDDLSTTLSPAYPHPLVDI